MSGRRHRRVGLLAGVVLILGGFGYLLYGGIGDNLVYFLTPSELTAKGAAAYDAPVRLGGQVVPGSVSWDAELIDLRFRITDGDAEIPVRAEAVPPQMFRDGIGVVVEGEYTRAGVFRSTNLMVKHSNEYEAPRDGHDPSEMYETLTESDPGGP